MSSVNRLVKALQEYFNNYFESAIQTFPDLNLQNIALWQSGFTGVLSGLQTYPGAILLVQRRSISDSFTTSFSCVLGIGLSADDPNYLEEMGNAWEDILEESIRADYHLGESVLDTNEISIESSCTGNVYVIQMAFTVQIDIGGFIYEEDI